MRPKQVTIIQTLLLIVLLAAMLSSCMTAKKATDYMTENKEMAANWCANAFPEVVLEQVTVHEDSAGFKKTVDSLKSYSDSLLKIAAGRNQSIDSFKQTISDLKSTGAFTQATADVLQAQLNGIKKVDTAALARSIEKKIRSQIKPCKDSIITKTTGISTAKYEAIVLAADRLRSEKADTQKSLDWWKKWCLITWGIIVACMVVGYFTRNLGWISSIIKKQSFH